MLWIKHSSSFLLAFAHSKHRYKTNEEKLKSKCEEEEKEDEEVGEKEEL